MTIDGSLPLAVLGTAHVAPGRAVSTVEVAARMIPPGDAADIERRTGIVSRHWAEPSPTTAAEVGAQALAEALAESGLAPHDLERIAFVTSTGGDNVVPGNATRIAAKLGLADTCDCIDVANGCVGFLTALDLAARCFATGMGPIGVVVVELCSRVIDPSEPRPYVIFADAAVAAVLAPGNPGDRLLASFLRNDGVAGGDVHVHHPLATRTLERVYFTTSGKRMGQDAVDYIRRAADAVLTRAGLAIGDVEWVVPHQPNGRLLELIIDGLGIDADKVARMVHDCGSVAAASIPISLHRLRRTGRVRSGDRILLVGVGTGLSYGAALLAVS